MDDATERYLTGITAVLCLVAGTLLASLVPGIGPTTRLLYAVGAGSLLFTATVTYQRRLFE